MTTYTALLDSCVLFSPRMASVLLYVAETGLYRPLWSDRILNAIEREAPKKLDNVTPEDIKRRVDQMRGAFPLALIMGHEGREQDMRNHEGDRHVLAAAVHGKADVLVTANIKHFPAAEMERNGIIALKPDEFLCDLLNEDPDTTMAAVNRTVTVRNKPPETVPVFLDAISKPDMAPTFAKEIRALLP